MQKVIAKIKKWIKSEIYASLMRKLSVAKKCHGALWFNFHFFLSFQFWCSSLGFDISNYQISRYRFLIDESIFLSTNRFFIAKMNFDRYKLMDRISIDILILGVSNFKQYIEFQCLSIDKSFYTCFWKMKKKHLLKLSNKFKVITISNRTFLILKRLKMHSWFDNRFRGWKTTWLVTFL